jgi:hypothetical protein
MSFEPSYCGMEVYERRRLGPAGAESGWGFIVEMMLEDGAVRTLEI